MPFSFKFNETTTSNVQKQYDAYAQYWLKKQNLVQNRYYGSLFFIHCENVLEYFFTEIQWDKSFLLHLGMVGQNINLAFQKCTEAFFHMKL